jgi:hypothetical protein
MKLVQRMLLPPRSCFDHKCPLLLLPRTQERPCPLVPGASKDLETKQRHFFAALDPGIFHWFSILASAACCTWVVLRATTQLAIVEYGVVVAKDKVLRYGQRFTAL